MKKNKGKGKKSVKTTEEQINLEAQKRLRSFLQSEKQSESQESASCSSSSYSSFPKPSAPFEDSHSTPYVQSSFGLGEKKKVFIKKIEVLLNGSPIDQVEDKQNEDECIQAYWRLFTFNGQMNSLFTNGISYDDFR